MRFVENETKVSDLSPDCGRSIIVVGSIHRSIDHLAVDEHPFEADSIKNVNYLLPMLRDDGDAAFLLRLAGSNSSSGWGGDGA